MPILFRATPQPSTDGQPVRSKANRARWQGILETTHQNPRRYEQHPRVASDPHSGHSVRVATGAGPPNEHADPVLQLLVNLTRQGTLIAAFESTHAKFRAYHADCLRLAQSATSDERAVDELL